MAELLTLDLAAMLAFGGFVPQEAVDDAIAHDGGKTMEKIGYLTELINARISREPRPDPVCRGEACPLLADSEFPPCRACPRSGP